MTVIGGTSSPIVPPLTRLQQIDAWLRRHPFIDFFFVGIGGTALIIGVLTWLAFLVGSKFATDMSMPITLIGVAWLLPRIFRLRG
jgi:hypothetical protein